MEHAMRIIDDFSITAITVDPELQPRTAGINPDHVRALEAVADSWPPLITVERSGTVILVDGFHRYAAAQNIGLVTVSAEIRDMPADGDLKGLAFTLNAAHGRPLTLQDRRTRAGDLLRLHSDWADREVGRRCGLAQPTVAKLREQLESTAQIEQTDIRVGQGGYTYTVGTNVKQRPQGDLPGEALGDVVSSAVGRLFTSAERRDQRQLTSYLRRLAVALEDSDDLVGWETADEAAASCRLVLGHDDAADLGVRLGRSSRNVLNVAIALGYDDDEDAG